jgi:3-hydroxyacyl-CoA dehydrogenase/3a,7a,12a-trihydroxy-5b-cholest-24-enoyl-CoA hydratase
VAIVTGAGNGLGRSHALLLASRGARVVVNDLGGSFTGEGASQNAADKVVAEIVEAGGTAVANYDSVTDGEKIVQTAVDTWGRVDIVINNAGILRDVSFHKMSQADWDLVYQVHVLGAFKVTHAAWPLMREAGYGRVIMTASAAGIYGNFGQANYAMAKLGLAGFANTLAIEGQRKNIHVNTIAPIAGSRMTETVLPPNLIEALRPEYVSPLVSWLVHEDCEESGGLFEVGGGFFGKLRWERAEGKLVRLGRDITPELVKSSFAAITSFDKTTHPDTVMSSMQPIMGNVEAGPSRGGNKYIDVDEALGYEFPAIETSYAARDVSLYALGVGAATDPIDDRELQLVYEMHGEGQKVLPTFGVIPAMSAFIKLMQDGQQAPGLNYGFDRLLHGEQITELKAPLPTKATLVHRARVKNIFDKGKHALVVIEVVSTDADGNELIRNELTSLIRNAGGWGGDRGPSAEVNVPPDRAPDAVTEDKIPAHQALLYRLTGDINPLHADPGFAKAFGFDRPILHGLCTFGYAGRHVINAFAPDADPRYFKSIQTRFSGSVFPGETLVTEMWKEPGGKIIFRCKVKERDEVVVSNAAIELYPEIPRLPEKPKKQAAASGAAAAPPRTTIDEAPISADIFNAINTFIGSSPDLAAKVKTVFKFVLSDPASTWTIDLKANPGANPGEKAKAECTLELSDADFMAMSTGKADPMKLFSSGKLKISGDIMASQKLGFLKDLRPEMVKAEMAKRAGGGGGGAAAAGPDPAVDEVPTSWDVFIAIRDHLERNSDLAQKIGFVFQFQIKDPDAVWTVDVKNGSGSVSEGQTVKPDCTLEIAESDFIDMTTGAADPMKLFTTGKLKISGNVMASQKLEFLQKIDADEARAAVAAARAAGQGPRKSGAAASAPDTAPANAPAIFAALDKRLADKPSLANEVAATVVFKVSDPGFEKTLSLDTESRGGAATTLTISDADLTALVKGEVDARDLYQRGKLRVDGDVTVAHRLGFLKGLI